MIRESKRQGRKISEMKMEAENEENDYLIYFYFMQMWDIARLGTIHVNLQSKIEACEFRV